MLKLSYKRVFYLIISIAFIARIYFVFFTSFTWYGCDTETYLKMGKAILDGKPISYFPNGYPLLVALVTFISGTYNLSVLVTINIAAQILTLLIAERILFKIGIEEKVRLIILFLIAFFPDQLSRVRFIMTEPLSVLLVMLSIYLFITKKYYLSGFSAYLSYAFRPSLILLLPILVFYQLYKGEKSDAAKIAAGIAVGFSLFVMTDITHLTAPSDNQTQNILVSIQSYGYNINHSFSDFNPEQIEHPVNTYITFALTKPAKYIKQRFLALWSLWGPYVPSQLGIFAMVLHGLRFPFFIIAVFTFLYIKRFGDKKDYIFILFSPVLSITFIHMLFFATQRHQFAAEPFVIILTVIGADYFLRKRLTPVNSKRRYLTLSGKHSAGGG